MYVVLVLSGFMMNLLLFLKWFGKTKKLQQLSVAKINNELQTKSIAAFIILIVSLEIENTNTWEFLSPTN